MGGEFGGVFLRWGWVLFFISAVAALVVRAKRRYRWLCEVSYVRIVTTLAVCCIATALYSAVDGYNAAQWRVEHGGGYMPFGSFSKTWQSESFIAFGFSTQLTLFLLVTAGFSVYGRLYLMQRTRPWHVGAVFGGIVMLVFGSLLLSFELAALLLPQPIAARVARAMDLILVDGGVGLLAAVVGVILAIQVRERRNA
jgi:hypothetical protein